MFLNSTKEQFVNIPYNVFQNVEEYSASFWVKDFGSGILFSVIGTNRYNSYPYLIAGSSGKFAFVTADYDNATPFSYLYKDIQDGKWHLISVVCKKSDYRANRNLYIDGKLVDSMTGSFVLSAGTKIQIGGNADGNGLVNAFTSNMKVDNIRIYNKDLDAEIVNAIYELEK